MNEETAAGCSERTGDPPAALAAHLLQYAWMAWRDAGAVDVMPEDVYDGLLRIQVSPTEGARVERRP